MNIEPLQLTKRDVALLRIKNLEIGRGTDGVVYKTGNRKDKNSLYKIYFTSSEFMNTVSNIGNLDSDGVRVVDDLSKFRNMISTSLYKTRYINSEGTRIGGIDSIYKAIERQKDIKRTQLQKRPIYVDGHFRGTVLHHHRNQLPMGYLRFFPFDIQMNVLTELLISLEELLDNYIYHIDLGLKADYDYKEANVLLSWFPKIYPNIIDIDGKSAVYTETYNKEYYYKSLRTYKNLVSQILFDIDVEKIDDLDAEYLEEKLANIGIKEQFIQPLLNAEESMDIVCVREFLNDIKKIKPRSKIKSLY